MPPFLCTSDGLCDLLRKLNLPCVRMKRVHMRMHGTSIDELHENLFYARLFRPVASLEPMVALRGLWHMEKAGASMLMPEQMRDSNSLVFLSAGASQRDVLISIGRHAYRCANACEWARAANAREWARAFISMCATCMPQCFQSDGSIRKWTCPPALACAPSASASIGMRLMP